MTDDEWRIECRARIAAWRASDHVHNAVGMAVDDKRATGKKIFKEWTETISAAMRDQWNQHWRQVEAELKRGTRDGVELEDWEWEEELEGSDFA